MSVERYRVLLARLLEERQRQGGVLSEDTESHFVTELDDCWWSLTRVEQDVILKETAP